MGVFDDFIETTSNVCEMASDTGRCRGYFRKFYYDAASGECREFVYGGCEGNDNRFNSIKECEARCKNN